MLRPISNSVRFSGFTVDNPDDQDWYEFVLANVPPDSARLILNSISSSDGLELALFEDDGTPINMESVLQLGRDRTDLSDVPANSIDTAFPLPSIQGLGRVAGLTIHNAGDIDVFPRRS